MSPLILDEERLDIVVARDAIESPAIEDEESICENSALMSLLLNPELLAVTVEILFSAPIA